MNLLALDASTEQLCLGLLVSAGVAATHQEPGGPQASRRMLPAASELLARAGLAWSDLTGLAVAVGPGAFTGLRSACAAAQGLALGLGLPVVPVDSLQIVAQDAWFQCGAETGRPLRVCVAVDARMGQVYDGLYEWVEDRHGAGGRAGHWTRLSGPTVREPQAVWAQWSAHGGPQADGPSIAWAGSGLDLVQPLVEPLVEPSGVRLIRREQDRSRALVECAAQAWVMTPRLDPARVLPVYVRDRVALTTAERAMSAPAPIS